jgi:hypothetical protein
MCIRAMDYTKQQDRNGRSSRSPERHSTQMDVQPKPNDLYSAFTYSAFRPEVKI